MRAHYEHDEPVSLQVDFQREMTATDADTEVREFPNGVLRWVDVASGQPFACLNCGESVFHEECYVG